ncbi:Dead-box atp-dependent rna helicase [Thalictrum thalictroides]|uniref:Dead-box atp-dependent rna helicase n=1 Tax=Thalictrum thalictroides TaxID=46969 RepID=A0A7J6WGP2_THATH|nr:Dead-box atp-dependent rna helicase [Thalictrum thalictroides]
MVKGEDAVRRKKNKLNRKKMKADTSTVSARIAGIIASKQRRKTGKRRMCEGMCFSLPTPDDPFNDNYAQKNSKKKKAKNPTAASISQNGDSRTPKHKSENGKYEKSKSLTRKDQRNPVESLEMTGEIHGKNEGDNKQREGIHGSSDGPSKFFTLCLNSIQKTLLDKDVFNGNSEHPLLLNRWGAEFLSCSLLGTDILETTGSCSSVEQIAWMVSIAADIITTKEKEGLHVANPFLLILVPSKEKAVQVRSLCKPLKALGIHTVSLHTDASLDHQIHGLKSCEPEFLVSTPERLLELVSVNAIDISELSFLVVDGLESFAKGGLLDQLKSIRKLILRASLTVVFCDSFGTLCTSAVQALLDRPITRLSLTDSVASQSACIGQYVHICATQEKPSKAIKILNEECRKRLYSDHLKVLFIEENSSKACTSTSLLIAEGYSISNDAPSGSVEVAYSKEQTMVTVTDLEHVDELEDLEEFEIVVITSFPSDIDDYVKILTGMARQSVNGVLHSCFFQEDAPLAGSLIEILEQCGQNVPDFLKSSYDSMLEH